MELYIKNDNLLTLDKLRNIITGLYVNTAAVTATLKNARGEELEGQDWPFTLAYVAASDGKYQGILEDGILAREENLKLIIDVDAGSDIIAKWETSVRALKRRE